MVKKGAGGLRLATCELRLPEGAKRLAGFMPVHMDCIIRQHRRWRGLAERFSIGREDRRFLWIAITVSTAMVGATLAERMAWRLLVRHLPRNSHEARDKLLYLMALSIETGTEFSHSEIGQIVASLRDFETDLKMLLRSEP